MRGFTVIVPEHLTAALVEAENAHLAAPDCEATLDALLEAEEAVIRAQGAYIDKRTASIPPQHGPIYPDIPGAKRFRRQVNPDRAAYGEAVLAGIRAMHVRKLHGELVPVKNPQCASGTAHNTGDAILKALRSQAAAALHRQSEAPDPVEVARKYAAAMKAKRGE